MRSLLKIHGGKSLISKYVISYFPPHTKYIETCVGGCSIILNKPFSQIEIINDIDENLFNLLYCLKNSSDFISRVNKVEYTKENFDEAKANGFGQINELILKRFSRGGLGCDFSWSERQRGNRPGEVNAWENFKKDLPKIAERLKNVQIRNSHLFKLIRKEDSNESFFYIDPPYLPSTRITKNAYRNEMTEKEHIELAEIINDVKGKVLLSGYPSSLYDELYKGWNVNVKDVPNHSGQSKKKQRRTECLWSNY